MNSLTVVVARKVLEAMDICTFELADANGKPLPPFSAGSHIDVHLQNGITRQYSLCNDPLETHRYLIAVLKEPASRGGSRAMHESVKEGDVLQIGEPRNRFALAPGSKKSLLLAGGIGVTPILCMAERLWSLAGDFDFHYCTRSQDRTAFLKRIRSSAFAHRVQFHFDDGPSGQKLDIRTLLQVPKPDTQVYVCGPKGFMDAVLSGARSAGWEESQLHYEFFSADVATSDSDRSFEVKLASSGRTVVVPSHRTVVEALAKAGVDVQTSCEQGVCGTCLTRVLEGEPDHRDVYLTPDERAKNDQFLPCCSRAKTAVLVLDL